MFRRNSGLLADGSRCRGSIGAVLGMGIHMRDKAKRQESIEYVRVTVGCSVLFKSAGRFEKQGCRLVKAIPQNNIVWTLSYR